MLGFGPLTLTPQFPIYIEDFNSDLASAIQSGFLRTFPDVTLLDGFLYSRTRFLQLHLGADLHQFWMSRRTDFEFLRLFRQYDLACSSDILWKFHGSLHHQLYWCWSF
jgi:hypothetical protein